MSRKAIIAGGSGFLGSALARDLAARGWDVVLLSRRPAPPEGSVRTVVWDARTADEWQRELEGAAAIFNFAGRSVACLHTAENRREIVASRVDSVRAIAAGVEACRQPPPVWIQASSLAIYGDPGERVCDENAPEAEGFSADVCRAWEGAFFPAEASPGLRRVALRIGFVLGRDGGALAPLAKLSRWFLGGATGSGRQYLSWIHLEDFCGLCRWAVEHPATRGIYNATGTVPVTNAEFMRELRRALHRPWSPPVPVWAVKLGARFVMKADADLALGGRRCVPRRFLDEGFIFRHPDLPATLRELTGPARSTPSDRPA